MANETTETGLVSQLALVEIEEDSAGMVRTYAGSAKHSSSLRIAPSFGAIWYTGLDFGFPAVRGALTPYTDSDGSYDETMYFSSRSVSLNLVVLDNAYAEYLPEQTSSWDRTLAQWNSSAYWVSELARWMSPQRRFRLFFSMAGTQGSRWMDLRADSGAAPVVLEGRGYREVQLQWVCPSGKMFSFDERPFIDGVGGSGDGRSVVRIAGWNDTMPGREYPETAPYNRVYPQPIVVNRTIDYAGGVPNGFIARMHASSVGTTTNPRLAVTDPKGSRREVGVLYVMEPGDVMEFNSIERSVYLVSGSDRTRFNAYLQAPIQWPLLYPGVNTVEYLGTVEEEFADEFDAYADIVYHEANVM